MSSVDVSPHFRGTSSLIVLTLKVEEVTFSPTNVLLLPDDDGGHDLLSELGLTLLDGSEEHVADRARRESVEPGSDTTASDHVQVLGTCIVSAVHS